MTTAFDTALSKLEKSYDTVLRQCYDALAADSSQEIRDALREAIADKLGISDIDIESH